MDTADVPTYVVDLENEEGSRWHEVIARERAVARRLLQEAVAEFEGVPEVLRWLFAQVYRFSGGQYQSEMQAWAEAVGVSLGTVTLLNCAYELSHVRRPKLFGCTAGVRWVQGLGMVHVRTLDWPLGGIREATRLFYFRRRAREFVVAGVPGQVGVLSGMLPSAYSVTINWAPPASQPSFAFGPAFLLRDTLESCDTYDRAVARLQRTRLSTSAYFTVCGTEEGQACVIERTQNQAVVRPMTGPVLAQANHHVAQCFIGNNEELRELEEGEDEPFFEDSSKRRSALGLALAEFPPSCTLDDLARTLDAAPVLNRYTCQRMVFCPAAGVVRVWGGAAG
jgi:predicted choloylglycine hydrolase